MDDKKCKDCGSVFDNQELDGNETCPNCGSKNLNYYLEADTEHYNLTGYRASLNWLFKKINKIHLTIAYLLSFSISLLGLLNLVWQPSIYIGLIIFGITTIFNYFRNVFKNASEEWGVK